MFFIYKYSDYLYLLRHLGPVDLYCPPGETVPIILGMVQQEASPALAINLGGYKGADQ